MPEQSTDMPAKDVRPSVAVLAPSLPLQGAGGVASAHFNLHRYLRRAGCKSTLLTFNETQPCGDEPETYRYGSSQRLRSLLCFGVHCYLKALGSKKPAYHLADIVASLPGARRANHRLGKLRPEVIVIPDHGAPGLSIRNKIAPVVQTVHHVPARFIADPMLGDFCPLDVARATALEQRALQHVDAVVCPSSYIKEVFHRTYAFDGEVAVIPNLVDQAWVDTVTAQDVRKQVSLPPQVPAIYIPSAGSLYKGAKYVFEIVRRVAGACDGPVVFYLSGPIDAALKAELNHVPENARLFMPGRVSLETNLAHVKSCSFGISPTLIENFSMAILEAGFCGVPMVAFAVGGVAEIVKHGETGLLVPLLDVEGLVGSAVSLLDAGCCDELRRTTGAATRARFAPEQVALQYLALFERCLEQGR